MTRGIGAIIPNISINACEATGWDQLHIAQPIVNDTDSLRISVHDNCEDARLEMFWVIPSIEFEFFCASRILAPGCCGIGVAAIRTNGRSLP